MARKRNQIELGKVDYNGSGRKNCLVTIEWELSDSGRFSMCGNIWNPRRTDIYSGGQNLETIAELFPHNELVQRMVAIWREYHLNDAQPGSPAQMAWLKANPAHYPLNQYDATCLRLADVGLNPDPNYLHNGKPYQYGTAWLTREIPADVQAEIRSWNPSSSKAA